MQFGQSSTDGWLLAIVHFAASEFGWNLDYIYDDVSLVMLLLLVRQKLNTEGKIGMSLADKERIDSMDWQKLVEESHKRACSVKI